jgi:TonB family protein
MRNCFTLLLLILSSLLFSQTVSRNDITRIKVSRKELKRQKAELARKDTSKFEQEGNTLTTWNYVRGAGSKTGEWKMIRSASYDNGELNGFYFELNERGDTITTGNYSNGRYSGEWKTFDGKNLVSIRNYDTLGNKTGIQFVADTKGQIIAKQFYTSADRYYSWSYCPDGNISSRGEMSAKGREGTWYEYRCGEEVLVPEDTLPALSSQWKNGRVDGFNRQYFRGVLVTEWHYTDGLPSGIYRKYENGILREEGSFINNIQTGQYYVYSVTGQLQFMSGYYAGTLDGESATYDTLTHVKVNDEIYDMGILLSHEKRTPDGTLLYSEKLISKDSMYYRITEYYENGKVKSKQRVVDNERSGKFESWYDNGKRKCVCYFFLDHIDGPVSCWNDRGVLVYRATAHMGEAGPDEQVWNDKGVRLENATPECDSQANKYAPVGLESFTQFGYRYNMITITKPAIYQYGVRRETVVNYAEIREEQQKNRPEFPGGEAVRVTWLKYNLHFPEMEREMGYQGINYVRFAVNADSTISDIEIVNGVPNAPGFDRELLRVARAMPKWAPATRNGKAIRARCMMGVSWVLE